MKKKLRFMFDYGTYPLWWFDGIDPIPECTIPDDCRAKDLVTELMEEYDALFINNKREFSYVGFQSKDDEAAFIRKIDEAIRLLKQQYGKEYEIIDDSGLDFSRENQMK